MNQPSVVEPSIAILVVWIFLYIYSMAGSIDFGASFWSMIYLTKNTQAGKIANRFLSPTWEITNTILVLFVVAVVGFFPKAAFMLGTVLLVPVSIILLLISLRSAFMVFAYSLQGYERTLRLISGITGFLVPVLLISALPITEGGFIQSIGGRETLLFHKWLTSPSVYMYMLFGLTSELFLSALFLADYAREAGENSTYHIYRKNAILFGPITLIAAVVTLLALEPEAKWLLDNIGEQIRWFIFSIIAFLLGYSALWWPDQKKGRGKPRVAVIAVAIQYGLATFGYGIAHLPYIVFPDLTVSNAFTNMDTFYSLLWVFTIGLAILLPGFVIFWRLFLKDKKYLQRE
ncbi:cytochrome d ubiquinol oxidase subunit II [Paenactinomyces guangxiensis]|uniref:Cytochrome d ubiquinol oxidase subunit II n=1 Tax=Paenactinomyces guangxiensis TaxID=1490290 RepID=A0A7W1WUW1_9BACL|nr:cytochrome d ubiquinol oxidase subunit II [Paenactinomyces guangxiensis]MBA4496499.1 cytochrome d ubiquinol oxidase subunit II [Paenactinomyces guangxiensis]MBH8593634.1 cytochrome d ubiquinol oxidase subunit II [Paenactinomyces guangxiensis]